MPSGRIKMTPAQREAAFHAKYVIDESGCWLWMASLNRKGYGSFQSQAAHRVAYQLLVGPIPDGLHIDHLCRVRNCVNPSHMEPVTPAENQRRGLINQNKHKTCCTTCGGPYDYSYMTRRGTPDRRCTVCFNANKRRWRAKLKQQAVAA